MVRKAPVIVLVANTLRRHHTGMAQTSDVLDVLICLDLLGRLDDRLVTDQIEHAGSWMIIRIGLSEARVPCPSPRSTYGRRHRRHQGSAGTTRATEDAPLSRILGYSTVQMTIRYSHLRTGDLYAELQRVA